MSTQITQADLVSGTVDLTFKKADGSTRRMTATLDRNNAAAAALLEGVETPVATASGALSVVEITTTGAAQWRSINLNSAVRA